MKPIRPINIPLTAWGTKGLMLPSNWAGVLGLGAQGLKNEKPNWELSGQLAPAASVRAGTLARTEHPANSGDGRKGPLPFCSPLSHPMAPG